MFTFELARVSGIVAGTACVALTVTYGTGILVSNCLRMLIP